MLPACSLSASYTSKSMTYSTIHQINIELIPFITMAWHVLNFITQCCWILDSDRYWLILYKNSTEINLVCKCQTCMSYIGMFAVQKFIYHFLKEPQEENSGQVIFWFLCKTTCCIFVANFKRGNKGPFDRMSIYIFYSVRVIRTFHNNCCVISGIKHFLRKAVPFLNSGHAAYRN